MRPSPPKLGQSSSDWLSPAPTAARGSSIDLRRSVRHRSSATICAPPVAVFDRRRRLVTGRGLPSAMGGASSGRCRIQMRGKVKSFRRSIESSFVQIQEVQPWQRRTGGWFTTGVLLKTVCAVNETLALTSPKKNRIPQRHPLCSCRSVRLVHLGQFIWVRRLCNERLRFQVHASPHARDLPVKTTSAVSDIGDGTRLES